MGLGDSCWSWTYEGTDPFGKRTADIPVPGLSVVFRRLLLSSFPAWWKPADVTPIPKIHFNVQFPITNTCSPVLFKGYKRLVPVRIERFMECRVVLPIIQCAYRKVSKLVMPFCVCFTHEQSVLCPLVGSCVFQEQSQCFPVGMICCFFFVFYCFIFYFPRVGCVGLGSLD